MGVSIIQGKEGKKVKVNQGVVIYVKPDGSVQGELVLSEKVIDASDFSAIIVISEISSGVDK